MELNEYHEDSDIEYNPENYCLTIKSKLNVYDKVKSINHWYELNLSDFEAIEYIKENVLPDYLDILPDLKQNEFIEFEFESTYFDKYECRYFPESTLFKFRIEGLIK